jgi:transcriptional regulator, Spx/MgsR family
MIDLYGIPNCDTMKKARRWLDEHGIEYRFHDYKKEGIDEERLRDWAGKVGWEALLNRRGMMWRKLPQEVREKIDEQSALRIMLETPSIIKRPVLVTDDRMLVGFSEETYRELLQQQ